MPLFFKLAPSKEASVIKHKQKDQGKQTDQLFQSLKASLGSGQMIRSAVRLPAGEDINNWIAMNTIELYNTTLLCYGVVSEFCTPEKCPKMCAGHVEYRWQKDKVAATVSAPEYVDLLADWVYQQLNDPTLFPQDQAYNKNVIPACKKILSRLFRVFAHVFYHHWEDVRRVGAEPHTNTSFKHFYYFVSEFKLIDESEFAPVLPLIEKIEKEDK